MKYIKEFKDSSENQKEDFSFFFGWLDTKKKQWSFEFTNLLMPFFDELFKLFKEFSENYNDNYDPKEIFEIYKQYIESSFDKLIKGMDISKNKEDLISLYYNLDISLGLFKDSLLKMSKDIDNYNSIYKLGFECFKTANRLFTDRLSEKYYNIFTEEKHIDDIREKTSIFFESLKKIYLDRVDLVEPEEVFNMVNINTKDLSEINFNPGDEVKYKQSQRKENSAIVSYHQKDVSDDSHVILVSKRTGKKFEIKTSKIIEIIPKHKSINKKISDKLKTIKDDETKMKKLNKFLYDILNEDNSFGENYSLEELRVSVGDTKKWLSDSYFKTNNIINFNKILKDVYEPVGHWGEKNPYKKENKKITGVVGLPWEEERWSSLNRINTNFKSLSILINKINEVIINYSKITEPFDFKNNEFGTEEFNKEYQRFINYLYTHRDRIFLKLTKQTGSETLNSIINTIKGTMKVGEESEKITIDNIKRIFDDIQWTQKVGESGERADMIEGVDVRFKREGKPEETIQVKTISMVEEYEDEYHLIGVGMNKHYNVDYIGLVVKQELYLFEYDSQLITLRSNGNLIVDKTLLVKKINIEK